MGVFLGGAWHPDMMLSSNRRRQRSELRPHPKEEAMSHALATVLHHGRKAASNIMAACLANRRRQRCVAEAGDRLPSATRWRRCFTVAAGRE